MIKINIKNYYKLFNKYFNKFKIYSQNTLDSDKEISKKYKYVLGRLNYYSKLLNEKKVMLLEDTMLKYDWWVDENYRGNMHYNLWTKF